MVSVGFLEASSAGVVGIAAEPVSPAVAAVSSSNGASRGGNISLSLEGGG